MRKEPNAKENTTPTIEPLSNWRVKAVSIIDNYQIEVTFNDGTSGTVDLRGLIFSAKPGIFANLEDKEIFNKVCIEHGVVTWPGEIDLAPDAMYEQIQKQGCWKL